MYPFCQLYFAKIRQFVVVKFAYIINLLYLCTQNEFAMFKRFLFLLCLGCSVWVPAWADATIDSLLNVYTAEIARSDVYIARRQARIDSLKYLCPQSDKVLLHLAQEYQHFQSDSARTYFIRLREAPEPYNSEAFLGLIQLYTYSGHYANAFALLDLPGAPSVQSVEGYKVLWLLYKEASTTSLLPAFGMAEWGEIAAHYYDSLLVALEQDTLHTAESRLWLTLYKASDAHDWPTALQASMQLINATQPENNQYAILAYGHAMLYEQAGDALKRREWLIRSAISDVRCGITDNGSSWLIARDCYDAGDLTNAHIISDYTLTNASLFNAPARYIQTYALGHTIGNEYEQRLRRNYINLVIALSALALVLFGWVLAGLYIVRQNKKLSAINTQLSTTNRQLKEANIVKEQYICRYLEVYNDYIRRLTTMARRAGEKDPSAFMDREMENFYRSFDDTFLSLYGTFVEDFNALLKPEARITPKPGERMTVEMRIFALILLGIDSSAKIAELLCYSPNTISNYRVKIKNNALGNRDDFEPKIRSLAARY